MASCLLLRAEGSTRQCAPIAFRRYCKLWSAPELEVKQGEDHRNYFWHFQRTQFLHHELSGDGSIFYRQNHRHRHKLRGWRDILSPGLWRILTPAHDNENGLGRRRFERAIVRNAQRFAGVVDALSGIGDCSWHQRKTMLCGIWLWERGAEFFGQ